MRKAKREELSNALVQDRRVILQEWQYSLQRISRLHSRKGSRSRALFFAEMDPFLDAFFAKLKHRDRDGVESSLKRMASLFFQVGLPHSILADAQIKLKRLLITRVIQRFSLRKDDIRVMCDLIEAEIDLNRIFLSDEFERLALTSLEASERNYRELIEEMEDLVVRFTPRGKILFVNSASLPLLGITADEAIGRTLTDCVHHVDRKRFAEAIRDAVRHRRTSEVSCEMGQSGGGRIILSFRIYPIRNGGGEVRELKGMARDITHARSLEAQLRKKVKDLQIQWKLARTISSTVDVETILNHALEALSRLFDFSISAVFLYDGPEMKLSLRASRGVEGNAWKWTGEPTARSVVGRAAREREIILMPDRASRRGCRISWKGIRSEIAVPLVYGKTLVGVLDIGSATRDAYCKEDLVRFSLFSSQLASAINNARLFEELKRANEELNRTNLRLDLRAMELRTSQKILEGISKSLESESILRSIADPLKDVCPFTSLSLFLMGSRRNVLLQDREGASASLRTELLADHIKRELRRSKLVRREMLDRPLEEQVFGKGPGRGGNGRREFSFCLPLMGDEGVFGALYLTRSGKESFGEEEIIFLRNVTSQISLGLSRFFSIREYHDRMEEISRMKADFSSLISHELRTPVTSLKNSIDILLSGKLGETDARQAHFLQLARKDVTRLTGMINDILELSQLESGSSLIRHKRLEVRESLDDAVSKVTDLAEERGVLVIRKVSKSLPRIYADPHKLEQILVNLLSNAIKFSEKGSRVRLGASLVTQLSRRLPDNRKLPSGWRSSSVLHSDDGNSESHSGFNGKTPYVEISVRDWGAGISQEKLDIIFEKFTQEDSSMTRLVNGTGLGLTITKHLTIAHQGLLWAESRFGAGSVFRCLLPACADDMLGLDTGSITLDREEGGIGLEKP